MMTNKHSTPHVVDVEDRVALPFPQGSANLLNRVEPRKVYAFLGTLLLLG